MPFVLVPRSARHVRVAVAVVLCALAPQLAAQQADTAAGTASKDPGMVIARTVNPRIAYRGVPTADNPIHSEATLFPSRTFRAAMDNTVGELVGDDALGARGSAGLHAGAATEVAMRRIFAGESSPLGPGLGTRASAASASGVVGGVGAVGTTVGGAVGRAVGGGMTGGLFGAMPAITPTQQGGGP